MSKAQADQPITKQDLSDAFQGSEERLTKRIDNLTGRIDNLTGTIDNKINQAVDDIVRDILNPIGDHFRAIDERFNGIEGRLDKIESHVENLDMGQARLERKLDATITRFDEMILKVSRHDRELKKLRPKNKFGL